MKKLIVVLFLFALTWLGGCGIWPHQTNVSEAEVIKLGFIGPLSGEGAVWGNDEKNATLMAVEEINNSNYIPGRKLEVIFEDGQCSGIGAATAAQKLVNIDRVKIVLGGTCSDETLAAAPITEQARVILFSSFSSNPALTDAGDYVFRNSPSDDTLSNFTADLINKKHSKIAIISGNSSYTVGVRDVFVKRVLENGAEIVSDQLYNIEEKDFSTYILKIKQSEPDAIFINPYAGLSGGLIVKKIKELGVDVPLYGTFIFGGSDVKEIAGPALNNLIFTDAPSAMGSKGDYVVNKFKEKFGEFQNSYQIGAKYDAVYIIADAIRSVGLDTARIRDYLYGLENYDGAIGNYRFDQNGDTASLEWAAKIIKDGEAVPYEEL